MLGSFFYGERMKLVCVSDIHANPLCDDTQKNKIYDLFTKLETLEIDGYRVIILGDVVDRLEFGLDRIMKDEFCYNVIGWCESRKWISGNHDDKMNHVPYCEYDNIYFCHGNQFDLVWGWFNPAELHLPDWLIRIIDKPTYNQYKSINDYHLMTLNVEYQATLFAVKNGYRGIVMGHTHCPTIIKREKLFMINDGDMVDSNTIALIDTKTDDYKIVEI
jgi:predicted phosphodiesterase